MGYVLFLLRQPIVTSLYRKNMLETPMISPSIYNTRVKPTTPVEKDNWRGIAPFEKTTVNIKNISRVGISTRYPSLNKRNLTITLTS